MYTIVTVTSACLTLRTLIPSGITSVVKTGTWNILSASAGRLETPPHYGKRIGRRDAVGTPSTLPPANGQTGNRRGHTPSFFCGFLHPSCPRDAPSLVYYLYIYTVYIYIEVVGHWPGLSFFALPLPPTPTYAIKCLYLCGFRTSPLFLSSYTIFCYLISIYTVYIRLFSFSKNSLFFYLSRRRKNLYVLRIPKPLYP